MAAPAAGSGLVVNRPAVHAAIEASLAALAAAHTDRADVALVFTTAEARPVADTVLRAVRKTTGARAIVGCSGSGVLTERAEVEADAAVAVLVVRDEALVATPFVLHDLVALGADAGARLGQAVAETVLESGSVLVLPDPHGLDPWALLARFDRAVGFVPVWGGVASGAPAFQLCAGSEPPSADGATATAGALVGLAVGGEPPIVGVAHGCVPIGEPFVVTAADGPVVHALGSRPALRVLKEAIETLPDPVERLRRTGLFAGVAIDPAKSPLGRGDFLVRPLVAIDESSGALALAGAVRVGQTVQFQVRDAPAAREDLGAMLDGVARALGGRRPAFGCYVDCAGRGRGLFGAPDHDVAMIRARLGDFPLAGFFGGGEFAPLGREVPSPGGEAVPPGGRNLFHTCTGVLALFPA